MKFQNDKLFETLILVRTKIDIKNLINIMLIAKQP